MKQKKLNVIFMCFLMSVLIFTGCGKDTDGKDNTKAEEVYFGGGDIIKYSYILNTDSYIQSTLPVVTNVEIKEMEFVSAVCSNDVQLEIELTDVTEDKINEDRIEYNGYYAYFPTFEIRKTSEEPLDISIEAFNLLINGEEVKIDFTDFYIIDELSLGEKYSAIVNEGDLTYESAPTIVWPKLPSSGSIGGRSVEEEFSCEYDVEILQYEFMGDFFTFDSFYVGGQSCSNEAIGRTFDANVKIPIRYQLNYADGVSKDNIVRNTYVVKYIYNGQTHLATSFDMCVWDDWNELNEDDVMGPVKRYIDSIQN